MICLRWIVFTVIWTRAVAGTPIDVFILAGQSNLEGRAHRRDLPPELNRAQSEVLFYFDASWGPLQPGSSRRPAAPDGFGPELSFGRTLALNQSRGTAVALIKHGVGGTSLSEDWRPDSGEQTVHLLKKVRAAIIELERRGFKCRLAAFVWMQGERDAGTKAQADAYQERLREFIRYIRGAVRAPDLPFVIGKITPHSHPPRPYSDVVRHAQENVVRIIPRTALVNTDDLKLFEEPAPDGTLVRVHFDAASLIILGRRLAEAALAFEMTP